MEIQEITYPKSLSLELDKFKEMDYYAVENYSLPIEFMMENAGLKLAHLVANSASIDQEVLIGIGDGNNGGGGLVAARRLSAWGYNVSLDVYTKITKEIPKAQLERAVAFGVSIKRVKQPDVWVDAYLGFSQRLPLPKQLLSRIEEANTSDALKISLDLPTGFLGKMDSLFFQADKVLTLAAPKRILYNLDANVEIFVADLGIPKEVYKKFNIEPLPFDSGSLIQLKR